MQIPNLNLGSIALIAEFTASVWTARKLDRKVSDDVIAENNAKSKGAARVNKNLLAGRDELDKIAQHVTAARNYVYNNTVPWSDNGQRLLQTARFMPFNNKMDEFKNEFDRLVLEFVRVYPTLITAQAMALGNMFNRSEYPPASEIVRKFGFNVEYVPVPEAGDLRVDVGNEAQRELRERLEKMANTRVEQAVSDVRTRLVEHLERMADRLVSDTDPKTGERKHRRFTETIVTSAMDLCELVRDYNFSGDTRLSMARQRLEATLTGVTATTLREDDRARDTVQREVTSILNQFKGGL